MLDEEEPLLSTDMPEERLDEARRIIRREFDVETLHKWREIRIIEEELDKGMQLRAVLEKLLLNGLLSF